MRILNARTIMRSFSGLSVCMSCTSNYVCHQQDHVVRRGFQRVQARLQLIKAFLRRGLRLRHFCPLPLKLRLFLRCCVPVNHVHHGHLYLHGFVPGFAGDSSIIRILRCVVDNALFGARGNLFVLCNSHFIAPKPLLLLLH